MYDQPPSERVLRLAKPTEDDITRILQILTDALENDNPIKLITGGVTKAFNTYIRLLVDMAYENGEIHVVGPYPEFDGVSLWAPPGADWMAYKNDEYQKTLPPDILEWLVHHAIPTYEELYKAAFGPHGYDVSVQAWHLKMIAVRPPRQRQGLGKTLMREVVQQAAEGKYRILTDCHTQISIRFFQKLGFRHQSVKNYYSPFGMGFPMWCMSREEEEQNT